MIKSSITDKELATAIHEKAKEFNALVDEALQADLLVHLSFNRHTHLSNELGIDVLHLSASISRVL